MKPLKDYCDCQMTSRLECIWMVDTPWRYWKLIKFVTRWVIWKWAQSVHRPAERCRNWFTYCTLSVWCLDISNDTGDIDPVAHCHGLAHWHQDTSGGCLLNAPTNVNDLSIRIEYSQLTLCIPSCTLYYLQVWGCGWGGGLWHQGTYWKTWCLASFLVIDDNVYLLFAVAPGAVFVIMNHKAITQFD